MRILIVSMLLIYSAVVSADTSNRENAIEEVSILVEKQRIATEKADISFLISLYPKELHVAEKGKYFSPKKEQVRKNREWQFNKQRYEIKNLSPPIVEASESGDIAWALTRIEKRIFNKESNQLLGLVKTSGIVVFRKYSGKWKIESVAETYE